ncbi:MAG: Peptidase, M23/M37 family [Parcubacteria group bacterium GW2011_GWF2_38_76]|nr:MAG: Peptidase, M23/M37 family [Parcubacteria group bacterium GW2011_GWF2_38_76]HBM45905.1 hypothetical protein [Patescibacteria group bacterium]
MFLRIEKKGNWFFIIALLCVGVFSLAINTLAQEAMPIDTENSSVIDSLRNEISDRNNEIKKLEAEIATLDVSLKKTEGQSKSLKNELSIISNTISQLNKQVTVMETKIKSTELNIQKLILEIKDKEKNIKDDKTSVIEMLQAIQQLELQSPIEIIFSEKNFGDGWSEVDYLERVQAKVSDRIIDLEAKKKSLEENKKELASKKVDLNDLRSGLIDQKNIANQNKGSKNKLLSQTQNQEANYKKILSDRLAEKERFEKELYDYEAKLKVAIDPTSYPKPGTSVLSWPVTPPYITQKFGKTSDSARLYVSGSHGGVDFRSKIGTPIKASLSGVVIDTEGRVARDGCQYGYWVLIKHANGLSTLYAHLSLVKVSPGQSITTGELIGYSGQTGYSEGPHLHFGVYVTQGLRIVANSATLAKNPSKSICYGIKTVAADPKAYLDPMAYLPITGSNIKTD